MKVEGGSSAEDGASGQMSLSVPQGGSDAVLGPHVCGGWRGIPILFSNA